MDLGIDFGTSYTKMAFWDNGRIIDLLEDQRIPSMATYVPSLDELVFGSQALQYANRNSISALFFKLNLKRNPEFSLGQYTLGDLLYNFFSFLQKQYLTPLNIRPDSISLSVPNNFGLRARRTLQNAAQTAFGLGNIVLVPEPLAALIGYNAANPREIARGDLLCIDAGGGTTDFSFLSLLDNQSKLLLESQFQIGQDAFSGSEIDRMVLRHILAPAYQMQHGEPLPAHILKEDFQTSEDNFWFQQWMLYAEYLKIAMSTQPAVQLNIPDFYLDHSLVFECSEERFIEGTKAVYGRLSDYWEEAVRPRALSLGLCLASTWNLDAVVLMGGASQTRGFKDLISSLAPGVPLRQSNDPDLNVIRGLCLWRRINLSNLKLKTLYPFHFYLEKRSEGDNVLERIPFDTANLELDFNGAYEICLIPLNSSYNLSKDDKMFHIRVYEVAEEDQNADLNRFMDQDLVLELSLEIAELGNALSLFLNLAKSSLELDNNFMLSEDHTRGDDILNTIRKKQEAALELCSSYRSNDPEKSSEPASSDARQHGRKSTQAALYRILQILDLYLDK